MPPHFDFPEHQPGSLDSDPDSFAAADCRPLVPSPIVRNRIAAAVVAVGPPPVAGAAAIDSVGLIADSVVFPVPRDFEASDSIDNHLRYYCQASIKFSQIGFFVRHRLSEHSQSGLLRHRTMRERESWCTFFITESELFEIEREVYKVVKMVTGFG